MIELLEWQKLSIAYWFPLLQRYIILRWNYNTSSSKKAMPLVVSTWKSYGCIQEPRWVHHNCKPILSISTSGRLCIFTWLCVLHWHVRDNGHFRVLMPPHIRSTRMTVCWNQLLWSQKKRKIILVEYKLHQWRPGLCFGLVVVVGGGLSRQIVKWLFSVWGPVKLLSLSWTTAVKIYWLSYR